MFATGRTAWMQIEIEVESDVRQRAREEILAACIPVQYEFGASRSHVVKVRWPWH
jgi:hypothetical protein